MVNHAGFTNVARDLKLPPTERSLASRRKLFAFSVSGVPNNRSPPRTAPAQNPAQRCESPGSFRAEPGAPTMKLGSSWIYLLLEQSQRKSCARRDYSRRHDKMWRIGKLIGLAVLAGEGKNERVTIYRRLPKWQQHLRLVIGAKIGFTRGGPLRRDR